MSDFETIDVAIDARGVATLTLNRPEQHNVLSGLMIDELTTATLHLADNAAVRIVVLTGAGKSFCAGGDLGWMQAQMNASRAQRIEEARKLALMLKALRDLPKPLIGRVNGQAYGGGIGLISVCDAAISVSGARFGLTETKLGLIPATISPYVVARIGQANALRTFTSARLLMPRKHGGSGWSMTWSRWNVSMRQWRLRSNPIFPPRPPQSPLPSGWFTRWARR